MRLRIRHRADGIVRDGRVNLQLDIGQVMQEVFVGDGIRRGFKGANALPDRSQIPAGRGGCRLKQVTALREQAQHGLRNPGFRDGFHDKAQSVFIKAHGESMTRGKRGLTGLSGQRVRAVHDDAAADSVQGILSGFRKKTCDVFLGGGGKQRESGGGLSQIVSVIDLLIAAGPDSHGGGVHHKCAGDGFNAGKMIGHHFAAFVEDGIFRDRVFRVSGIGDASAGGSAEGEAVGQAGDEYGIRAGERRAVIDLAGALGDEGDGSVHSPVPAGRVRIRAAFRICLQTGELRDSVGDGRVRRLRFHELRNILGFNDPVRICRVLFKAGDIEDFSGLHRNRLIPERSLGRALQHHQAADLFSAFIGMCAHGDNGSADAHGQGGGMDIQALILVELAAHVQKQFALLKVHFHMAALLLERDRGFLVQRHNPVRIQAYGCGRRRAGLQGFAAGETDILHDEAVIALRV